MKPHTLKVDSVQLSFDGRKILQDIALQCSIGEIVGLLGRNGSGKSSLLKIIFGSLKPSYRYVSIDDRYISLGQQRPEPQHHDLEEAITAALAGKPVSPPGGPAVGCSIVFLQK